MTKQELILKIQDALQRDEILDEKMKLQDLEEWDSLAVVSMIALYDTFGVKLNGAQILACQTIRDLLELAKDKINDF